MNSVGEMLKLVCVLICALNKSGIYQFFHQCLMSFSFFCLLGAASFLICL